MAKRVRERKYRGDLNRQLPPIWRTLDTDRYSREVDAREAEIERRLALLFKHYRVPRHKTMALVLAMARDWVPGFQTMRARVGAKSKWGVLDLAHLRLAADVLMAERGIGRADAARVLAKRDPWRSRGFSAETLLRRSYGRTEVVEGIAAEMAALARQKAGKEDSEPLTFDDL